MGNSFAYSMMILWPLVTYYLLKRYGISAGALIALLGSYMFLPASFVIDLPGLPGFDKFLITTLTIFTFLKVKGVPFGLHYLSKPLKVCFALYLVSPIVTSMVNQQSYLHLPGLSFYDGFVRTFSNFFKFLPFFIGLAFFRTKEQHVRLFKFFAIATFIYAFLALYEIRMSPQLHSTFYGYFPHAWNQQYRSGGFRAVVFMGHGLLVAMFLALGVAFWSIILKSKSRVFRYASGWGLSLVFITLMLSKSLGALILGGFSYVFISYIKPKLIVLFSIALAFIFLSYPVTSILGIFPHQELLDIAESIDEQRAGSLKYRFDNEQILLEHANDSPWFGWGGWGRNRVYDPETGWDISVTDGAWIIKFGTEGWLGYLSTYLFLFLPVWLCFRYREKLSRANKDEFFLLASHSLIVSIIMIDQIPNASLNPLYWLIVGSLFGRFQVVLSEIKKGNFLDKTS
jgi:hypothetical protein